MKKPLIGVILLFAVLIIGAISLSPKETVPGKLDDFSKCLTEKKVKMWGAYWCPHCKNQKEEFGDSWEFVTYTECSLPGGSGQTKECKEAGIEGYPTWEFEDGERMSGEIPLEVLAEKSGCDLPSE